MELIFYFRDKGQIENSWFQFLTPPFTWWAWINFKSHSAHTSQGYNSFNEIITLRVFLFTVIPLDCIISFVPKATTYKGLLTGFPTSFVLLSFLSHPFSIVNSKMPKTQIGSHHSHCLNPLLLPTDSKTNKQTNPKLLNTEYILHLPTFYLTWHYSLHSLVHVSTMVFQQSLYTLFLLPGKNFVWHFLQTSTASSDRRRDL